jgi:16S rRNA (uracil1498-N3)-methyltransferase
MRIPRIYQPVPLAVGGSLSLDAQAAVHVVRVLRLKQEDQIIVFNGEGGEYSGVIAEVSKREVSIKLLEFHDPKNESPISICLLQGVSRGERMDYTLQKAVELGVNEIYPVLTKHTTVHLNSERKEKRRSHWQGVVNSACEQCGRNTIPEVHAVETLFNCLSQLSIGKDDLFLVLNHRSVQTLASISKEQPARVTLVVGPEGGFAEEEIDELQRQGFISVILGPRVLRTETAALAAISVIQSIWGDFK